MRHKNISEKEKSTGIALVFFLFCALLIGIGVGVKIFLLFLSAKFDGAHQVILQVENASNTSEFIALSPDNQTVSVLRIDGASQDSVGKYLGIPVDIHVKADPQEALTDLGQYILFHSSKEDTLNIIDRIRIFLYTSSVKSTDISQKDISFSGSNGVLDSLIPQFFTDHTLYGENLTIAVVNATGVSGLGNTVAHVISDLGGNVISVTTGDDTQGTSLVYSGSASYTTKRLAALFHATVGATTSAMLTDIVLTVGKSSAWAFE